MVVHCLAYVGKQNEPLFVHVDPASSGGAMDNVTTSYSTTMYLESIIHASLDIVEERRSKKSTSTNSGTQDMYLGQLFVVEDYRVFAWCSNTQIKTIVVCDISTSDVHVKDFIQGLYKLYIQCIQNPFQLTGKSLLLSTSKKFRSDVEQQVYAYNQANQ